MYYYNTRYGERGSMVRVAGCDSVGCGFESHRLPHRASMVELVDTIDSKSIAARHLGSSPSGGTKITINNLFLQDKDRKLEPFLQLFFYLLLQLYL